MMKTIQALISSALLLVSLLYSHSIAASELDAFTHKSAYRASFDLLTLPNNESMGLLGASYLIDKHGGYRGLGTYSAVTGERGGFFTIGLELGHYFPIDSNFRLNGGLFLGGGGGGAAPQGGGLMLRQSIVAEYLSGNQIYSFGVSAVQFPNGDISSQQLTLGYSWSFDTLFFTPDYSLQSLNDSIFSKTQIASRLTENRYRLIGHAKFYRPTSHALYTTGLPQRSTMRVLGGELQYLQGESRYSGFATFGANGGGVDGFAQLGVFTGLEAKWLSSLYATAELHLAAAGGGRVDTGGGLLIGAELGLRWMFTPSWFVITELGYLESLDASFAASSIGMSLGYQYGLLGVGDGSLLDEPVFTKQHWRFRALHQSYLPVDKSYRKATTQPDQRQVDLVGMALDLYLTDNLYLSGQALGAYAGGAGGYASGMFALGYQQPINAVVSLGVEVAMGSAGGGGLDVGDGLVSHMLVNGEYRLDQHYSIGLDVGRFEAYDAQYQVDLLQFFVGYRFIEVQVR